MSLEATSGIVVDSPPPYESDPSSCLADAACDPDFRKVLHGVTSLCVSEECFVRSTPQVDHRGSSTPLVQRHGCVRTAQWEADNKEWETQKREEELRLQAAQPSPAVVAEELSSAPRVDLEPAANGAGLLAAAATIRSYR